MDSPSTVAPAGTVSHKHVLLSEILAVTSAMRKNSRWAASGRMLNARDSALARDLGLRRSSPTFNSREHGRGNREADLMAGFQELKQITRDVDDITQLSLNTLLGPFFALIRSPLSTGPITSTALAALHSFFVCGLINAKSIDLDVTLTEFSSAVSHCKFEASDSSGDELVMLRIMTLVQDCMCHKDIGQRLGDIEVCEMLETVLTTACQMRLTVALRRFSESTMHTLVRTLFSRLHTLDPEVEETKLKANADDTPETEIKLNPTAPAKSATPIETENEKAADGALASEEASVASQPDAEPVPENPVVPELKPEYGLPSIIELLRVLINILDPNDQVHTDSTRLTALGILNAAFEAAGPRLCDFPSLEGLVLDSGCKFLFQLARSENVSVLHDALRVISTVFETMRPHLKLQQELFLAFTIDRLAPAVAATPNIGRKGTFSPRPGTPAIDTPPEPESPSPARHPKVSPARGETRALLLETLSHISRHSCFMVDVYTNYDCDINCENLFERLIEFLTKSVYSSHYSGGQESQQQHSQYLCLDMILIYVNDMVARVEGHYAPPTELMRSKSQKQLVITGAARFNTKPKTGLAFLEENGLIYADLSPDVPKARSLAKFLKNCTRLDKRLLGDFISRPDNLDLLNAFIGLFDFNDKPVAEALRELLEAFRLPGESQQIARITETFASSYFASGPAEVKNEDAVYVLTYSIIMLNTDQHNPQVRKRMTIDDYRRNLRGVNDGADFSPEYLQEIFDSIRKREIIMPEEHTGQLGFAYAWKELLARSRVSGDLMVCNTTLFDIAMFKASWKPVISAISHAFISFDDDHVIQRAIAGFRQCATLAGRFDLPDVFDFVVVSLSQATSLLSDSLPTQVPNFPVVDVDGSSITVSSLSAKFGTNFKGQLAAVVLFNIVNGHGNALREGWTQIFEMFQNLFVHSLLPTRMLQMEDFLGGVSMIPLKGRQSTQAPVRHDVGLLSALSSYLMTPYGSSSETLAPDVTDADVENTLCTLDCVTSCRLDELYGQIVHLDLEALVAAIRALEALAHERTVARLKQESDDIGTGFNAPATSDNGAYVVPYDPASVFLLETMVSIACQTPQHVEELWPIVFEHLSALLSASTQYSILLIERAVVGLLRLCLILAQKSSLRDQIYVSFDILSGLPSAVSASVAEQVISGVVMLIQKHRNIIRSQTEWNLVFALIRSTISHPEAARVSFELITKLASDGPEQFVTVDNFSGLITLLDDFATSASMTIEMQQNQGRRGKSPELSSPSSLERGKTAIDLLFDLRKFILPFMESAQLSKAQAWRQLCLPLVSSLGRQSTNASREVRHSAISQLQRLLLGPQLVYDETDHEQVDEIFNRVLFPLMDELLRPPVFSRDPKGMPETRLRASALLCKSFMHFEVRDSQPQVDIRLLWIQVLDLLDRMMNIDKHDQVYEAIPESLKNVILVMNAAQILVPPSTEEHRDDRQRSLWTATQERMERFLPGFLAEVIAMPPVNMDVIPNSPAPF
ncbi:Sec7-domain-containing protein [Athelia psychrophila]|uniref:Sec7-domain-containing protein n=1 Tax=Athelia psychrophila TaxID=1759441 RepID=A0A166M652_9AGAM|nr:Sec7-domain-containing protein [Fibularhizoctonia sp. CBS 109695]